MGQHITIFGGLQENQEKYINNFIIITPHRPLGIHNVRMEGCIERLVPDYSTGGKLF